MLHQDWKPIIFEQKKHLDKPTKPQGKPQTLKHIEENELPTVITYNHFATCHLKTELQKARLAMKKSQVSLANELNVPKDTIQKIESGVAIYDANVLSRIERKLNVKFTRPNKSDISTKK